MTESFDPVKVAIDYNQDPSHEETCHCEHCVWYAESLGG
jgi:hypothetical protein